METPFYSTSMCETIRRRSRCVSLRSPLTAGVTLIVLYSACREGAPRAADSTGAPAVSTTNEPLRALGTEPFWALDIDSSGLRFITPDDTSGMRFPPIAPIAAGDTMVWTGATERAAFDVRIWREQCSDGMSDRVYPYAARVRIDATDYRGCADRRAMIVAVPKRN